MFLLCKFCFFQVRKYRVSIVVCLIYQIWFEISGCLVFLQFWCAIWFVIIYTAFVFHLFSESCSASFHFLSNNQLYYGKNCDFSTLCISRLFQLAYFTTMTKQTNYKHYIRPITGYYNVNSYPEFQACISQTLAMTLLNNLILEKLLLLKDEGIIPCQPNAVYFSIEHNSSNTTVDTFSFRSPSEL